MIDLALVQIGLEVVMEMGADIVMSMFCKELCVERCQIVGIIERVREDLEEMYITCIEHTKKFHFSFFYIEVWDRNKDQTQKKQIPS